MKDDGDQFVSITAQRLNLCGVVCNLSLLLLHGILGLTLPPGQQDHPHLLVIHTTLQTIFHSWTKADALPPSSTTLPPSFITAPPSSTTLPLAALALSIILSFIYCGCELGLHHRSSRLAASIWLFTCASLYCPLFLLHLLLLLLSPHSPLTPTALSYLHSSPCSASLLYPLLRGVALLSQLSSVLTLWVALRRHDEMRYRQYMEPMGVTSQSKSKEQGTQALSSVRVKNSTGEMSEFGRLLRQRMTAYYELERSKWPVDGKVGRELLRYLHTCQDIKKHMLQDYSKKKESVEWKMDLSNALEMAINPSQSMEKVRKRYGVHRPKEECRRRSVWERLCKESSERHTKNEERGSRHVVRRVPGVSSHRQSESRRWTQRLSAAGRWSVRQLRHWSEQPSTKVDHSDFLSTMGGLSGWRKKPSEAEELHRLDELVHKAQLLEPMEGESAEPQADERVTQHTVSEGYSSATASTTYVSTTPYMISADDPITTPRRMSADELTFILERNPSNTSRQEK